MVTIEPMLWLNIPIVVVLLDEVEKPTAIFTNILLQVMDSRAIKQIINGVSARFRNVVLAWTTNRQVHNKPYGPLSALKQQDNTSWIH